MRVDRRSAARAWTALAVGAIAVHAALLGRFALRGRVNADEGFYLYGARLLGEGELPWSGFAHTQMPLTVVAHALPQRIAPGLLTGRIVSAAAAVAAVAVCVAVVRRLTDAPTAAIAAVGAVSLPATTYYLAITKTYAWSALAFALLLAAATSRRPDDVRWPLAMAAACLLVWARAAALPVALAVAVLAWRGRERRTRARTAAVAAAASVPVLGLALADVTATRFNLLEFHQILWQDADGPARWSTILRDRIPDWFGEYPLHWTLALAAGTVLLATGRGRALARTEPGLPLVLGGILVFLAAHLTPGQFGAVEYFAPAVPALVAASVVVLRRTVVGPGAARPVVAGALAVALVAVAVGVTRPAWRHFDVAASGPETPAAVASIGDRVAALTEPGDEILALWLQGVTVEARRRSVPGVTLGPFSYLDVGDRDAERLGLLNPARLADLVVRTRPAAVVWTDIDRWIAERPGALTPGSVDVGPFYDALDAGYELRWSGEAPGPEAATGVEIWVRRAGD